MSGDAHHSAGDAPGPARRQDVRPPRRAGRAARPLSRGGRQNECWSEAYARAMGASNARRDPLDRLNGRADLGPSDRGHGSSGVPLKASVPEAASSLTRAQTSGAKPLRARSA
jgi:hypothetical protein